MADAKQCPMTRAQWDQLSPHGKGYASYMFGDWPGSEVPNDNPYPKHSAKWQQFNAGQDAAVLDVQDADD